MRRLPCWPFHCRWPQPDLGAIPVIENDMPFKFMSMIKNIALFEKTNKNIIWDGLSQSKLYLTERNEMDNLKIIT
jgi:hypothetical protein